ncbi:hypothetical protein BGO17_01430 [Candidatus Saccharibacteria bacterium 49-20]|nr:MAG: hypothetical protein BGO17_01430 [Candidatus Saccharibacteria bacterium 49-20]
MAPKSLQETITHIRSRTDQLANSCIALMHEKFSRKATYIPREQWSYALFSLPPGYQSFFTNIPKAPHIAELALIF